MKTQITDFSFSIVGYGHYYVTYTSPVTGKVWGRTVTHMPLIDRTKNSDDPRQVDLDELKAYVKGRS